MGKLVDGQVGMSGLECTFFLHQPMLFFELLR